MACGARTDTIQHHLILRWIELADTASADVGVLAAQLRHSKHWHVIESADFSQGRHPAPVTSLGLVSDAVGRNVPVTGIGSRLCKPF
jgi:hypothetical protein